MATLFIDRPRYDEMSDDELAASLHQQFRPELAFPDFVARYFGEGSAVDMRQFADALDYAASRAAMVHARAVVRAHDDKPSAEEVASPAVIETPASRRLN